MKIRTNKGFLKMPWSMEDTIENLRDIKVMMQKILLQANKDGKGEEDVKEVAFDFDRAINALKKQIPKELDYEGDGYDENGNLIYDYAKCRVCGHDFEYGINDWGCKYCSDCGQALDWNEVQENEM